MAGFDPADLAILLTQPYPMAGASCLPR
jgi:hypothetical protein